MTRVGSHCKSLEEYLEAYAITLSVMQTSSALERCSFEALELCHDDGITYAEARFCPALHTRQGLSFEQVLKAVEAGKVRAEEKFGIQSGLIVCAMRHHNVSESEELAKLAVAHKDHGVVGFDIAGPEKGFPPQLFAKAYEVARAGGLGLTCHAGEGEGLSDNVATAVTLLGVTRVGHGVAMADNASTMALVRDRNVCIEQCITSNVLTKAVESLESHPAKRFLNEGITLNLSTDGVTMTDTTLSEQYFIAQNQLHFTRQEFLQIVQNGFLHSFQPDAKRQEMAKHALAKATEIMDAAADADANNANDAKKIKKSAD